MKKLTEKQKKTLQKHLDVLDKQAQGKARDIVQKVARGIAYNRLSDFIWKK
jgi:hypothetical protein